LFFFLNALLIFVSLINIQPRKKPPKEGSQLEEKVLNTIVCRIIRFIMHELIHPKGKYQDPEGDVAKNADLANWSGKGNDAMGIIQKNFEDEQKRIDEKDRRWPGDAK